jgi:integrase
MEFRMHSGLKMRRRQIKYLSQDEVRSLFRVISSLRDRLIFNIMYKYGLRASEVGLLTWEDIDFKNQKIMIWRVKGGVSGKYNIFPDTLFLLNLWRETISNKESCVFNSRFKKSISRKTLDYLFKKYGKEINLPKYKRHCHTLRHSIAVHMLDAGHGQEDVKDHLGHRYIQSTDVYAVLSNKKRDAVFNKMKTSVEIVNLF